MGLGEPYRCFDDMHMMEGDDAWMSQAEEAGLGHLTMVARNIRYPDDKNELYLV